MELFTAPKPAHVILEAVRLTSNADIPQLGRLTAANSNLLKLDLLLRILLTFLPESTDPSLYVGFLRDLAGGSLIQNDELIHGSEPTETEHEARHQVRRLQLLPLVHPQDVNETFEDSLTFFLLHRARQIDVETGSLLLVAQLIEPFINRSPYLRRWAISTILPLLRLEYEYYPNHDSTHSLNEFEIIGGKPTIDYLLSQASQQRSELSESNIGRDLRGLVGPWMYGESTRKRRKLTLQGQRRRSSVILKDYGTINENNGVDMLASDWDHVNEWLLDLSLRDFSQAVEAINRWDGPCDVDYGHWEDTETRPNEVETWAGTAKYAQAALASIYATSDNFPETLEGSHRVFQKITKLVKLPFPSSLNIESALQLRELTPDYLKDLSPVHLLRNSLLRAQNPFAIPSHSSMTLCYFLLLSGFLLARMDYQASCRKIVELSLFGSKSEQMAELKKISHLLQTKPRGRDEWIRIRNDMLWVQNWKVMDRTFEDPVGVFSKIDSAELEMEIMKLLLTASCYDEVSETYCTASGPISLDQVERSILDVALSYYDGASNGNKTRGGVRKTFEIIDAFNKNFPNSESFRQTVALLSATHAMSFYSLTLHHGVPFQPVNIRAHKDPISLIERILDQNAQSYTKLDDLIEIGRNLASAGLEFFKQPHGFDANRGGFTGDSMAYVERRITAMAIDAALSEEDFDTAYSYVMNRLTPPHLPSLNSQGPQKDPFATDDDVSWRAAYHAGRSLANKSGKHSVLRVLEQRMELLSRALLLAPSSALAEILGFWRQCEEALTLLVLRESEEEKKWDDRGDRKMPGGLPVDKPSVIYKARELNQAVSNEEAPMGLFDVAKGAAAALSKNAFPLRSPRSSGLATSSYRSSRGGTSTGGSGSESSIPIGADHEGRIRKRDMVSNMVTGGLASGIGWVIGAPTARQE